MGSISAIIIDNGTPQPPKLLGDSNAMLGMNRMDPLGSGNYLSTEGNNHIGPGPGLGANLGLGAGLRGGGGGLGGGLGGSQFLGGSQAFFTSKFGESTYALASRPSSSSGMVGSKHADELAKREEQILKDQLAKSAAAVMIQSCFRGWVIRRKYIAVIFSKLTAQSISSGGYRKYDTLPDISDLNVQERLLRKYRNYCRIFDLQSKPPPDFPFFCASYIQAVFRAFVIRRSWQRFKAMTKEDKMGSAGKEARHAMQRRTERFQHESFVKAAKKIQRAWRSYYV
jgi:hypothetical protein